MLSFLRTIGSPRPKPDASTPNAKSMELLESVTNSTRKSSPTRPQHLQLPHGDAHTPTSNPDDILGLDYVPTLPPPPPNSPGTPHNQNETESAARRRNSRTPREGRSTPILRSPSTASLKAASWAAATTPLWDPRTSLSGPSSASPAPPSLS